MHITIVSKTPYSEIIVLKEVYGLLAEDLIELSETRDKNGPKIWPW